MWDRAHLRRIFVGIPAGIAPARNLIIFGRSWLTPGWSCRLTGDDRRALRLGAYFDHAEVARGRMKAALEIDTGLLKGSIALESWAAFRRPSWRTYARRIESTCDV